MKTLSTDLNAYLQNLIDLRGGSLRHAQLYEFTLFNGVVVRVTDWDQDLTYNTHLFSANPDTGGPYIKRGALNSKIGLDVTELDLELYASPAAQVNNVPILQAIRQGDFEGARFEMYGLFLDCTTGDNGIKKFSGKVGNITDIGRAGCKIKIVSGTQVLNVMLPRATFGPSCRHTLFDANCGLTKASFTASGTVHAGSNRMTLQTSFGPPAVLAPPSAPSLSSTTINTNLIARTYWVVVTYVNSITGETTASPEVQIAIPAGKVLHVASPSAPGGSGTTTWNCYVAIAPGQEVLQNATGVSIGTAFTEATTGLVSGGNTPPAASSQGYYAQGVLSVLSGPNAGLSMSVRGNTGGVIVLNVPLPNDPVVGDSLSIVPGCNKQFQTCVGLQGGVTQARLRFGGQPFIPSPERGF